MAGRPLPVAAVLFALHLFAVFGMPGPASAEEKAAPAKSGQAAGEATVRLVPTFESIGVYWRPQQAPASGTCAVWLRPRGDDVWQPDHPLWHDARDGECRGSLVHLSPDTAYEVGVAVASDAPQVIGETKTWSERFPIAFVVHLPELTDSTFVVDGSGTPDGYVLFTHEPSKSATIDVGGRYANNIVVAGSHVIIRGLNLRNAGRDAILLSRGVHDVIIEDNDISGWGRIAPDGWGRDRDAAIAAPRANAQGPARIIVQRNRMHHPRSDSNAWDEHRDSGEKYHPLGPQAITFWNTPGQHVIRYNEIYSDEDHKFNDCIGGGSNFTEQGFPNRDSDIYGNRISDCWDDAIEAEGDNRNVRIWGNYIDRSFVMLAVAPTVGGPAYLWRNVVDRSRRNAKGTMLNTERGVFVKTQSRMVDGRYWGNGRIYVYHNTLLQRPNENRGVSYGVSDMAGADMKAVVTRNNILHVNGTNRVGIADGHRSPENDFDYDLYFGGLQASDGQEPHGILGAPVYADPQDRSSYALDPASPGYDAGVALGRFNSDFAGAGPDFGAVEAGLPPLRFGIEAAADLTPASN